MTIQYRPSVHTATGGGAGVDEVTNADGSLTISPIIGNVIASLNVGNANTWTADQTFNDNVKVTLGTGGDADIYYDGTDLIIDCRVVGTGNFILKGDFMPQADSTWDFGTDTVRFADVFGDGIRGLDYYTESNQQGVSSSFTDTGGNIVTVTDGIVTDIAAGHMM